VQERLGHTTIGITLGTYSHVTGVLHADAADLVANMIHSAVSNPLASAAGEGHE